jgi:simple sugar transport system permease protein
MTRNLRIKLLLLGLAAALLAWFPAAQAVLWALLDGAFGGRGGTHLLATLRQTAMIGALALAVLVALRAGCYNLGGEGQMVIGALTAALVGLHLPGPPLLVTLTALAAAMLAGAAWASVAAWAFTGCGVPVLIASLLLNYPARSLCSWLVNGPLRDEDSGLAQTMRLERELWLPALPGTDMNLMVPLVLVLALLVHVGLTRTRAGYRSALLGHSAEFVRFSGMSPARLTLGSMAVSGAIAGLAGALAVFDLHYRYVDDMLTAPLFAWSGIAAVLLVASRPAWVLPAALLLAAIKTSAFGLERKLGLPREAADVLQALIVLAVAGGVWRSNAARQSDPKGQQ